MLKIFTELSHYRQDQRIYLADILRPFLPKNRFSEFGIDNDIIKLVENIEDSDICLLPMAWNYYLNTKQIEQAEALIHKAESVGKRILVGVRGDYFVPLPNYDHIIGLYTSSYRSMQNARTISMPVIIRDPLTFLGLNTINTRGYNETPSIGFCGQVDSSIIISSMKMIKLALQNFRYFLHLSTFYPGTFIPPTYIRKNVLNILDKASNIHTKFIRRGRYQGGVSKKEDIFKMLREDFFQNINNTDYTLCIRGTGNFSARFYETLALGRIPVFINTDCILPFNNEIDWQKHVVWIDYDEISDIKTRICQFHQSLTKESFQKLQYENRMLWEKYFKFSGFFKEFAFSLKKE